MGLWLLSCACRDTPPDDLPYWDEIHALFDEHRAGLDELAAFWDAHPEFEGIVLLVGGELRAQIRGSEVPLVATEVPANMEGEVRALLAASGVNNIDFDDEGGAAVHLNSRTWGRRSASWHLFKLTRGPDEVQLCSPDLWKTPNNFCDERLDGDWWLFYMWTTRGTLDPDGNELEEIDSDERD